MSIRRSFSSFLAAAAVVLSAAGPVCATDEVFGPPNMLKTMQTPFTSQSSRETGGNSSLSPLSLAAPPPQTLSHRLLQPRLYLPGRMVLGSCHEFIIKGPPGYWVAIAMADKNSGAKPICGHEIRLGADRKLVTLGQIPDTGVLSLYVETPIQGDLIGQPLYFEAALWKRPDFSDMELAMPVPSESTTRPGLRDNGVIVSGEPEHKRGIRIVPDAANQPLNIPATQTMDSGRP